MPKKSLKMPYFDLYRAAHSNAIDLVEEAEILFDKTKYSRAYALAFTALEEISKSQLAADVFTDLITEEKFNEYYCNHKKKVGRMAWATNDASRYLDAPDGEYVDVRLPTFVSRNDSMYVSMKDDKIASPSDVISREDAYSIIHTAKVALQRIYEMTDYWGHQIGTKGS